MSRTSAPQSLPINPLDDLDIRDDEAYRRRLVRGILESYNSNYDFLVEALQNAIDALEDAELAKLPDPRQLRVFVDLKKNTLGVLDTGMGMTREQLVAAYTPHVSFKPDPSLLDLRGSKNSYRGYKGVGLTFLAYGTDDVRLHSKRDGVLTATRMQYGRAWAEGDRSEQPLVTEDTDDSPLTEYERGTFIEVGFSQTTEPKSLAHLAAQPTAWPAIIRTRSGAGQVLLDRKPLVDIDASVEVVKSDGTSTEHEVPCSFLYPHEVDREPEFRFLDVIGYYAKHHHESEPPDDKKRQDGVHAVLDTDAIRRELTPDELDAHKALLDRYEPVAYGFVPYQASVWGDLNKAVSGNAKRTHLSPGLIIAINGQRLADHFDYKATRFETFSRNVMVLVHFDNARPDQGRKTVQEDVYILAGAVANRTVQYLADQRAFLKPAGEAPTPEQRRVEKSHDDWMFNVREHAKAHPLHAPPVAYVSEPATEQDVIGLFHQLCALGVFPGIKISATSQIKTYDSVVRFECPLDTPGLAYVSDDESPLGLAPFVLGSEDVFETQRLTLEFKNNIDALVAEVDDEGKKKSFEHIDMCVCWSSVAQGWTGYEYVEIDGRNIEQREHPGVTHILQRDGSARPVQVTSLKTVFELITSGRLPIDMPKDG